MTQAARMPIEPDDLINRARALLQNGNFSGAATLCDQALDIAPDHEDALYTLAVAQRYQRKFSEALATNDRLLAVNPSFGRAHQERGHCLRDMGDKQSAFAAYQNAVAHNAALVASWQMLGELHQAAGRADAADFALGQSEHLTTLPPELLSVAGMIAEGKYLKAEKLCRSYLQTHGHHVEAMRQLAEIGVRKLLLRKNGLMWLSTCWKEESGIVRWSARRFRRSLLLSVWRIPFQQILTRQFSRWENQKTIF